MNFEIKTTSVDFGFEFKSSEDLKRSHLLATGESLTTIKIRVHLDELPEDLGKRLLAMYFDDPTGKLTGLKKAHYFCHSKEAGYVGDCVVFYIPSAVDVIPTQETLSEFVDVSSLESLYRAGFDGIGEKIAALEAMDDESLWLLPLKKLDITKGAPKGIVEYYKHRQEVLKERAMILSKPKFEAVLDAARSARDDADRWQEAGEIMSGFWHEIDSAWRRDVVIVSDTLRRYGHDVLIDAFTTLIDTLRAKELEARRKAAAAEAQAKVRFVQEHGSDRLRMACECNAPHEDLYSQELFEHHLSGEEFILDLNENLETESLDTCPSEDALARLLELREKYPSYTFELRQITARHDCECDDYGYDDCSDPSGIGIIGIIVDIPDFQWEGVYYLP